MPSDAFPGRIHTAYRAHCSHAMHSKTVAMNMQQGMVSSHLLDICLVVKCVFVN